jgi:hypothetical protein
MAVHLFTGNLGGGKSLASVGLMVETLVKGGYIFTNVEIFPEAIKKFCRDEHPRHVVLRDEQFRILTPREVPEFHKYLRRGTRELPVYCVIDEAGKYFNARRWNDGLATKMEISDFVRESRKLHVELVFIVQELDYLDKQFRLLCQYRWRFQDLGKLHVPVLGKFLLRKCYDNETEVPISYPRIGKWWVKDARYYQLYNTDALVSEYAMAEVEELKPLELETVQLTKAQQTRSLLKQCLTMKGIVIIICALCVLLYNCRSWVWGRIKPEQKTVAAVLPQKGRVMAQTSVKQAKSGAPGVKIVKEKMVSDWSEAYLPDGEKMEFPLTTENGTYRRGEMSEYGLVEELRRGVVRIRALDGGTVYLVYNDRVNVVGEPGGAGSGAINPGVFSAPPVAQLGH